MRLIDADKLKTALIKHFDAYFNDKGQLVYSDHICTSDDVNDLFDLIDKQPIAYDVDKVKSQMKELVEHPCGKSGKCIHAYDNFNEEYGGCEMCVALRADDIVKAGGNS